MSDARKFKGTVQVQGDLNLPQETIERALIIDASGNVASSVVTSTELALLSGATTSVADVADDVADLVTLSGVPANSTDLGTFTGTIIPDASTVKGALQSLETAVQSLPDPMEYKGAWDASTNSPALSDGTGNNGDVYYVSVAGTQFTPPIAFKVGDKAVYNGATAKWEKWDVIDPVNTDEVPEGTTNLYFTEERAQDAVGTILVDSDTVDLTYSDATPSISATVKTQLSITSDASGIKLVNDSATPGNTKYYGTDATGTKGFFDIPAVGSPGDIQETSFSLANNQASPANVTGFVFANAVVRSFKALVSVEIDATADLFETFSLQGIQKGASWEMAVDSVGDESGIVFSITSAGQIQYTSASYAGFSTGLIKFRAQTTSI